MKFSTGFGLVVIATATVATAQPRRDENSARLSYNEKREAPAAAPRRENGEVVQIATPTTVKHGKEFIVVGEQAGQFVKLRVDAAHGKVTVHRVRIDFTDGTTKSVLLDKILAKGKSATIDLKSPKAIERLVITTDTEPSGEYAVYGISGSGEVGGVASR